MNAMSLLNPSLEILIEIDHASVNGGRLRACFIPNGRPSGSWVGEWSNSHQALSESVSREFSQWWSAEKGRLEFEESEIDRATRRAPLKETI